MKDLFGDVKSYMYFNKVEGGAGGGGELPKGEPGKSEPGKGEHEGGEKLLTQEHVNKLLADHKRGLKKEIENLTQLVQDKDATIDELRTAQQSIEKVLKEISEKVKSAPDAKPIVDPNKPIADTIKEIAEKVVGYEAGMKSLQDSFDKRIVDLEANLEKESSMRELAQEEALAAERDMVLQKALSKLGCIDMDVGLKLFEDCCEIDEETGEWWVVNDKTGEDWPILEGVNKMLPTYLRKPVVGKGGAGSRTTEEAMGEIDKMKTRADEIDSEIQKLQQDYKKSPTAEIMAKVSHLTRERNKIKRDLRVAKV